MSTETLQKELEQKFGKDLEVGALRNVGGQSELTIVVKPQALLQVLSFLKEHKQTPMHYMRNLTAIDYPKQFLPPPADVDPFLPASSLELKGRSSEHTGGVQAAKSGRSAPLDPPRISPEEIPHALNELESIKGMYKEMRVMWGPPPAKPKVEPPKVAKEPADTKVSNDTTAKMVIDIKRISAIEKKALPAPAKKEVEPVKSAEVKTPAATKAPEAKPVATSSAPTTNNPQPPVVPKVFAPGKYDLNKITLVYNFMHMESNTAVHVRVDVERDKPEVDSISSLWPAANWYEREVFDLYGVVFKNHPDLRRIFMDYPQFPGGNPLRKDYERPGFMVRLPKV